MIAFRCQKVIPNDEQDTREFVVTMGNTYIPGCYAYANTSRSNYISVHNHSGTIRDYMYNLYGNSVPSSAYNNLYIGNNITDYRGMFNECVNFNHPVDFSKATCAIQALRNCKSFNQPINGFSYECNNFVNMLANCTNFNSPVANIDLNPSSQADLSYMFFTCNNFNQPVNISNAKNVFSLFSWDKNFNSPVRLLNMLDNSSVGYAFQICSRFNSYVEITGNCRNMQYLFSECTNFNRPFDMSGITSNGIIVEGMFFRCSNFNQPLNFPNLYVGENSRSYILYLDHMFHNCIRFNSKVNFAQSNIPYDLNFIARNINLSMSYHGMFENCTNLNLSVWGEGTGYNDIYVPYCGNTISTAYMFANCTNYSQRCYMPDSNIATNCSHMFDGCSNFNNEIYFSGSVNDLSYALNGCRNFTSSIRIRGNTFRQINVKNMICPSPAKNGEIQIHFNSALANQFNKTDSSSLIGKSVSWTYKTNCFYTVVTNGSYTLNIQCYYNYNGR